MSVAICCPGCEHQLRVRDELLGKRVKCPSCKSSFTAKETMLVTPGRKVGQAPKVDETKPTVWEKLLYDSKAMLSGLALMAVGGGLLTMWHGIMPIGVFVTGFVMFLYALAGSGSDSDW